MILKERIQTQTQSGCVDRIVSIVYPPDEDEAAALRGTWFFARGVKQAEKGMFGLRELLFDAVHLGRVKEILRELDYRVGSDVMDTVDTVEGILNK